MNGLSLRAIAAALLLPLVLVTGCASDDPTGIQIEVESDLPEDAIAEVFFEVRGPGLPSDPWRADAAVAPGQPRFPLSVVLVREGPMAGPFTVSITGRAATGAALTAAPEDPAAPIAFVAGRTVQRRYVFADPGARPDAGVTPDGAAPRDAADTAGRDVAGPGGDVAAATDASGARDGLPSALVDAPPADGPGPMPALDAMMSRSDVGPDIDAGSCRPGCSCTQSCQGGDCLCKDGCGCTLGCAAGSACTGECRGTGTACTINAQNVSNGTFTCGAGASCEINARGMNTSNVDVICQDSDCELDCSVKGNCRVRCEAGARCVLRCGQGTCMFTACPGGGKTCGGDNVQVCNRACP